LDQRKALDSLDPRRAASNGIRVTIDADESSAINNNFGGEAEEQGPAVRSDA